MTISPLAKLYVVYCLRINYSNRSCLYCCLKKTPNILYTMRYFSTIYNNILTKHKHYFALNNVTIIFLNNKYEKKYTRVKLGNLAGASHIVPILSALRERKSAATKIRFSAHPQTSLCHRETGFDSRNVQEDAWPYLRSLGALSIHLWTAISEVLLYRFSYIFFECKY